MTRRYKPLKAPQSKRDIAAQLRWLSEHMRGIAASMEHYSADAAWAQHAKELAGAAVICACWSCEIEGSDRNAGEEG
jgi:hypothetical protein